MKWVCFAVGAVLGFALVAVAFHPATADLRAGDPPCVACW